MKRLKIELMEKILILDNYDSFTYNIVHLLHELGAEVDIARNDRISVEEAGRYNRIILSPGPGIPSEAGILPEVVKRYAAEKSILGICLGEQAIGECFGAELENLPEVFHGICTPVRVIAEEKMFSGLGESFDVGRYHSWVVSGRICLNVLQLPLRMLQAELWSCLIKAMMFAAFSLSGIDFDSYGENDDGELVACLK